MRSLIKLVWKTVVVTITVIVTFIAIDIALAVFAPGIGSNDCDPSSDPSCSLQHI